MATLPAHITAHSPPAVTMGFGSLESFEFLQRTAKMFTSSSMVPTSYQSMITKGYGNKQTVEPNSAAIPNCMVALDMAQRMNANPLMIMQNLHIIEGRPSWSSQFIIASINCSGKFSPLRFDLEWLEEIDAQFSTFEWIDGRKVEQKQKIRIRNARCVAWAIEKGTGERLESAPVTMEMAVAEGWYGKNGSKWRSMPDLMMRYRSAAFFGRIYAPELLMGLPATEELHDVIDIEQGDDGKYAVPQKAAEPAKPTLDFYPQERFDEKLPEWRSLVALGKKTPADLIANLTTRAILTDAQIATINGLSVKAAQPEPIPQPDHQENDMAEHADFLSGFDGE